MKMKVELLLLIVFVGCLHAQDTTQPSNRTNEACRKLVNSMAAEKGIYCAGLIKDKVFIITKDDTVFEFPYSNIDEGVNKWNLQDVEGVPLKDKWPALHNHPQYAPIRRISFQCFTFVEANTSAYLIFETKGSDNTGSIIYDVDQGIATVNRYLYWGSSVDVVLLSTNIPRIFYQLRRYNDTEGPLQITTCKSMSPSIMVPMPIIASITNYSNLCKVDGSVYKLAVKPVDEECDELQWNIMMGFVSDKKFYLFTGSSILMFSEDIYTKPGSEQDAYVVGSGSLLECGGAVPITKKRYNWIWILITVLVILLVILFIILCIVRRGWKTKRTKKLTGAAVSARSELTSKQNLSAAQVSGRPSARSGLNMNKNLSGAQVNAPNSTRSGLGDSTAEGGGKKSTASTRSGLGDSTAEGGGKKGTASTRSGLIDSNQAPSSNAAFSGSNNQSARSKLSKAAQQSTTAQASNLSKL